MKRFSVHTVSFFLALSILLAGTAARAFLSPPGGERAAIEGEIRRTMEEGYNELNVDKILSIYSDDAVIIGFVMGEGDKERLRGYISRDLSKASQIQAEVKVVDVDTSSKTGEALVQILISMQRIDTSGENSSMRKDTYFLKMRKAGQSWKVFMQSYRDDFRASDLPHGGKSGPVRSPSHY